MSQIASYFFDITTSAQWSGHPVGIVRVERELATRARKHLGDRLGFCVYDKKAMDFKIVKDELVPSILSGAVRIDFEPNSRRLASPASKELKRRLRNLALEVPAAYQFIQRLRGHTFSIEHVKIMREQLKLTSRKRSTEFLQLSEATSSIVELSESVAIVSGGLDWEHKQLRAIYGLKQKTEFKFISIIYDLIPINLPHYVVPPYINLLGEYFGELLWATDGCLCISETTRIDFIDFCRVNGVTPPATCSFPLGSDLPPADADPDGLPSSLKDMNYVLFVSTIEPRKNHRTVYEAWCHALLTGTIDPRTSRLVFVGRQGWLTGDLVHEISTNPLTRDTIITLTNVSDSQLAALYRGASFTILPSFYEGFGLPLAEALGHGKVCLTSGAGALAEIAADLRIDIDPRDTLRWATNMAELLNDPDRILQIEAKIRNDYKPRIGTSPAKIFLILRANYDLICQIFSDSQPIL